MTRRDDPPSITPDAELRRLLDEMEASLKAKQPLRPGSGKEIMRAMRRCERMYKRNVEEDDGDE